MPFNADLADGITVLIGRKDSHVSREEVDKDSFERGLQIAASESEQDVRFGKSYRQIFPVYLGFPLRQVVLELCVEVTVERVLEASASTRIMYKTAMSRKMTIRPVIRSLNGIQWSSCETSMDDWRRVLMH